MFSSAQDVLVSDKIARVGMNHHFTLVPAIFFLPFFQLFSATWGLKLFAAFQNTPVNFTIQIPFFILFSKWMIALYTHWGFFSPRLSWESGRRSFWGTWVILVQKQMWKTMMECVSVWTVWIVILLVRDFPRFLFKLQASFYSYGNYDDSH